MSKAHQKKNPTKGRLNVDLLRKVADEIEREDVVKFDMDVVFFEPENLEKPLGCLAAFTLIAGLGRTRALAILREDTSLSTTKAVMDQAGDLLGLDPWETEIFMGYDPFDGVDRHPFTIDDMSGVAALNTVSRLIPDALRWMADNRTISWTKSIAAVRSSQLEDA